MKKSKRKKIILSSIGLLLGIVLIILGFLTSDHRYAGILLGLGTGISAPSFFYLIAYLWFSDSEIKKFEEKKQIENKDERNIMIREKTGYMCNKIISYCLAAVTIIISFMEKNKITIYLLASLLIMQMILNLVIGCYYSKRM